MKPAGTLRKTPLNRFSPSRARRRDLAWNSTLPVASDRRRGRQPARNACNREVARRAGYRCQLNLSPDCLGYGQDAHEVLGRAQGGDPTDPSICLWACRPCNSAVESSPAEARARGLKVRSYEGVEAARAAVARICGTDQPARMR